MFFRLKLSGQASTNPHHRLILRYPFWFGGGNSPILKDNQTLQVKLGVLATKITFFQDMKVGATHIPVIISMLVWGSNVSACCWRSATDFT